MADGIKVVTLNARLRSIMKLKEVLTWLQPREAKLILLQDTHTNFESEYVWRQVWEGSLFFSHGTNNLKGTCILIHKSLPFTAYKSIQDKNGRYVITDAEINGLRLTLCNIYDPNEDNTDFYIEVIQHVESLPNDNRIIGDFNLVLNILIDKKVVPWILTKNHRSWLIIGWRKQSL